MTAKILKHKFVNSVAEGTDATLVRPSNWNDDHDLWHGYRAVTGTTDTITNIDHLALITYNNAGAVAAGMAAPTGGNMPLGWTTRVRNIGTGLVTITGTGGATFNGAASYAVKQFETLDIHSIGTSDYAVIPLWEQSTVVGGQLPATATGDDAAAGKLGEFKSAGTTSSGTATVTISIASPAVISWTGHPLSIGSVVKFTTTGALPTGITASVNYWVSASGFGPNSFQISSSIANALAGVSINTSGTQSGVQTGSPLCSHASGVNIDLCALPLTAGDWDVYWGVRIHGTATITSYTPNVTLGPGGTSPLVSLPGQYNGGLAMPAAGFSSISPAIINGGPGRVSLAAAGAVYFSVSPAATTGSLEARAGLWARRMR